MVKHESGTNLVVQYLTPFESCVSGVSSFFRSSSIGYFFFLKYPLASSYINKYLCTIITTLRTILSIFDRLLFSPIVGLTKKVFIIFETLSRKERKIAAELVSIQRANPSQKFKSYKSFYIPPSLERGEQRELMGKFSTLGITLDGCGRVSTQFLTRTSIILNFARSIRLDVPST